MIRVGVFRFERLLNFVKEESEREGKILWKEVAFVPKKESQENLINVLSFHGWRVITKAVRTLPDGSIYGDRDLTNISVS
jgi:hypothetical protein